MEIIIIKKLLKICYKTIMLCTCTGWAKFDTFKGKLHYPNEIGENRYRCLMVFFNEKLNVENRISISIVVSEIQSGFLKSAFWKTICKYLSVENFEFL